VEREPKSFQGSYKDFFCRLSDPTYIKSIKMEILTLIANEKNGLDIVSEYAEYVSDANNHISRLAIAGLAKVALRVEGCAKRVLEIFLEMLTLDVEHIRGATLSAMKDYLRKFTAIEIVRPFLDQLIANYSFTDDESRIALVWVLGEFGEHIKDAPYVLEDMVANFTNESAPLRIEILTTLMKLFFKRPPEVQPILGKVFNVAINDFSHADVHDRALLYYRLLRTNPQAAAQVVCNVKQSVQTFLEDDNADTRDKLFEEFNTMSVIYGSPSSTYIKAAESLSDSEDDADEEGGASDDDEEAGLLHHEEHPAASGAAAPGGAARASQLSLDSDVELESPEFQGMWARLGVAGNANFRVKAVPGPQDLEDELNEADIFTMASGQQGTTLKVYLYSKTSDGETFFLVELVIQATCMAQVTFKTNNSALGAAYQKHFSDAMRKFVA
jgi:AP-4 complex subunit beta-1